MRDITGQKFNRLTAVKYVGKDKHNLNKWLFQCECGNYKVCLDYSVRSGHTMSCGCYNKEILKSGNCRRQHGMCGTRIYNIWKGIHNRCNTNKENDKNYKWYKNISYCPEWEEFLPFYEWAIANGYRDDLSIDRIDPQGDYEPSNCRWVDATTQANNKSNTRLVTYSGRTLPISEWARLFHFCKSCFYERVKKGESEEQAINYFEKKFMSMNNVN